MFDRLFFDKELTERIVACDKINWVQGVTVSDVLGETKVEGVVYRSSDGAITYQDVDAVFVAIGQDPHNEEFSNLVKLDERGYVVAGEDCVTTCPGIFVAGDCRTKKVRQCATAVGDGAVAGFNAAMYVDKIKGSSL